MEQKCHKCGVWVIKPDDVYCSKDGAKLRQIQVTPDPDAGVLVYIPKEQMQKPSNVVPLTIKNVGSLPYIISNIRQESEGEDLFWIQEKGGGKGSFIPGEEIKRGAELHLELVFDLKRLRETPISSGNLFIEGYNDRDPTRIPIAISNVINDNDVIFYPDSPLTFIEDEAITWEGKLRLNNGIVVVKKIECNVPGVIIKSRYALPYRVSSNEPDLEFSVIVDKKRLDEDRFQKALSDKLELPIAFHCLHRENNPIVRTVPFSLRKKAQLMISRKQFLIKDLFLNRTDSRKVYLRNSGGVPLTVHSGKISCNRAWIEAVFPDLSYENSESVTIEPKKDVCMELLFHCERLDREVTEYDAVVTIPWNEQSSTLLLSFDRISEMPAITDYLAVDFGTTNTCIALARESQPAAIIPLEPGKKDITSIPTVIEFNDLSDPDNPDYVVGMNPHAMMYMPDHMDRVVATFKRRLGKGRIPVIDGKGNLHRYSAEQLLELYIRKVLKNAEGVLNRKIDKVLITYPPKFNEHQVQAIRKAYENLDIRLYRKSVDEASAAAIYNIFHHQELESFEGTKVIMVADFGGGTTDLAILKCSQELDSVSGRKELKADILGVDGDPEFGGEDVTHALIDIFYERFKEQMVASQKFAETDVIVPMSKEREETLHDKSARLNFTELRRQAERTKIFLDDADVATDQPITLDIVVNSETDTHQELVNVSKEELTSAVMPRLDNIVNRMKNLFSEIKIDSAGALNRVDHIFLAGKASKMPVFKEKIQNQFPDSKVWLDHKLAKESVAMGAAEFYQQDFYAGSRIGFKIENLLNKVHNDIGFQSRNQYQERIFLPLLKSNASLPATARQVIQLPDSASTRLLIMEKIRGDDQIESHPEDFKTIAAPDIDLEALGFFYTPDNLSEVSVELSMNESRELTMVVMVGDQTSEPIPVEKRDQE